MKSGKEKVIFFGNGPLAEYALAVIAGECQVIFHARTREDLEEVCRIKRDNPEARGAKRVCAAVGAVKRLEANTVKAYQAFIGADVQIARAVLYDFCGGVTGKPVRRAPRLCDEFAYKAFFAHGRHNDKCRKERGKHGGKTFHIMRWASPHEACACCACQKTRAPLP